MHNIKSTQFMKTITVVSLLICALVSLVIPQGVAASEGDGNTHHYVVKGKIVKLPEEARPGAEILIRHEAIPNYVDVNGKMVGMRAMTMPFWLGDAVSLDGFTVGDDIEFEFVSTIRPRPDERVVAIKKLTKSE